MTPSARLQAAIEVLEELQHTAKPVDRFLRDWFRARRYAGSKDRVAVAARVFQVLRHRASLAWRMADGTPRSLVIASLAAEGRDPSSIETLFDGSAYGPPPLNEPERAALASPRSDPPPLWVEGEFPRFLEDELSRSLGNALLDEMRAMCERAPIDLRVNTLKASRDEVLEELRGLNFTVEPTPWAPFGIRILRREGVASLSRTHAYTEGHFVMQDEAAQIASVLCAARPGQRILDLAAGAGGKALAFAAAMNNQGLILARDNDARRLAQLRPRATRAGATIIEEQLADAELPEASFDCVFVDAPCSGSGAWRRQPELKWRLTPERLFALQVLQDRLLDQAAEATRDRIVYTTCSVLACENADRVAAFLGRHPDFAIVPARQVWTDATALLPPPGMGEFFHATPRTTGTDGFFAAVFVRLDNLETAA